MLGCLLSPQPKVNDFDNPVSPNLDFREQNNSLSKLPLLETKSRLIPYRDTWNSVLPHNVIDPYQ